MSTDTPILSLARSDTLLVDADRHDQLIAESLTLPSHTLSTRQRCDLELLANGAFAPLRGFLGEQDHQGVIEEMRLTDGTLWPIPITLDVPDELASSAGPGARIALRDAEGALLAILTVEDRYRPDRAHEAERVFGTNSTAHPGVADLLERSHAWVLGGPIEVVDLPTHHDARDLRRTPAELVEHFAAIGASRVVAFQTRNPMHRAHVEITRRAADELGAHLLLHPVVGMTQPGDIDHHTRVRVYRRIVERYEPGSVTLALLELAMRMAGPREALLHAIIRRNHGATHLIVGRDHAGPGADRDGTPFYGPYDAQDLLAEHAGEIGVEPVPFRMMVHTPDRGPDAFAPVDEIAPDEPTASLSGTQLRAALADGSPIPSWFTYPEVVEELRRTHRPPASRGLVVLLTGLSGSGKSTVANVLRTRLLEDGSRTVTLLDGDLVRQHLSSELGFSKEHRDLNVRRIGWVAAEVARHGGTALCCPIAPYDRVRRDVRAMVEEAGAGFVLVHVATSLEHCEQRDRKGLYAKARAGLLTGFTGIDDPYEVPDDAEIVIDTAEGSPADAAQQIWDHLIANGWLETGLGPAPTESHHRAIRP